MMTYVDCSSLPVRDTDDDIPQENMMLHIWAESHDRCHDKSYSVENPHDESESDNPETEETHNT